MRATLTILFLAWCWTAPAAITVRTFNFDSSALPLPIPDGSANAVSDTRVVSMPETRLEELRVTLTISGAGVGGILGDLFVRLTHVDSGISVVLVNRPGRTPTNLQGYTDDGLQEVVFWDGAPSGDIHDYRLALNGSDSVPLSGPLTGVWQPDGRVTVPDGGGSREVVRNSALNDFRGVNPNGEWTLFVADLSSGGTSQITAWGLQVTPVPEPGALGLATFCLVILGGLRLRGLRMKRVRKTRAQRWGIAPARGMFLFGRQVTLLHAGAPRSFRNHP